MKTTRKRLAPSQSAVEGRAFAAAVAPAGNALPAPHAFAGNLDACGPRTLSGWLHDSANPRRACEVEVRADGIAVARLKAESFRIDLLEQRIGDGFSGFQMPVPEFLLDGAEHIVEVREAATGYLLPGSPMRFKAGTVIREQLSLDNGRVRGAFRLGDLAPPFEVEVVDLDSRKVVASDMARADAKSPGIGQVEISLPPHLFDGRPHAFSVRVCATGALLGELALIMPMVSTPESALIQYARAGMKPSTSWTAGFRYDALTRTLESAVADAKTPRSIDAVAQLLRAHKRLVRGFSLKDKDFEPLTFPEHRKPDASIVIPVHNKFPVTYHCLCSLLLAPNKATFEVILVNDGSTDETLRAAHLVKGVKHIRNAQAQGFVRACNRGAAAARGRFVVMLNNDTEVTPNWLDELLWPFEHFDGVGLTGAKLVYADGTLQEAGGIVWGSGNPWNYGRNGNAHEPRFNYARQVDYISGACLAMPLELWNKVGGFTQDFAPAYFEDTDLAFKVRAEGLKTVYTPLSQVVHFEGASSGTDVQTGMKRFQEINRPKFKARWHDAFRGNGTEGEAVEFAKDRNVRMRALVIDAQTPTPDKDAGSYAAIQEIRMLQALGFKCSFFPQNLAWMANYTDELRRMGVEALHAPYWTSMQQLLQERGSEFDLIYITRYHVAQDYLDFIRQYAPRAKIALMLADLHFLRELRAAIHKNDPALKAQALKVRDEELAVMRRVDLVLSYTDVEQAVIVSHNGDESRVDKCPWVAETVTDVPGFAARKDVAFLGGFGHKPNAEAVEWFVRDVMPILRRRMPGVKLRVFGSNMPDDLAETLAAEEDVVVEGWVEDVRAAYDTCRVFIAPLQSGAGIKGKVIAALAHGVPTVMSPVAAEGISVAHGTDAFIASSPEEWVDCIRKVYGSHEAWQRMSKAAHASAERQFGFRAGVAQMQKALQRVDLYTTDNGQSLVVR